MSFEYDEAADLMGEGMPKGNKRAGFIGLMVAKARRPKGLQRGPTSYDPNARPKNTPATFDLTALGNPSKDLQRRFGNRRIAKEKVGRKKMAVVDKSAKGRFTKEERDELKRLAEGGDQKAKDKLEEIQAAERARKGKQLGKEVKKRQPKKGKTTQADEFAAAQRRQAAAVDEVAGEDGEYDEEKDDEEKLRDLELINRRLKSMGRKEIPQKDWLGVRRYDPSDKHDILKQAIEWARGEVAETVTIPVVAAERDPNERTRVNRYRDLIGQREFDVGAWARLGDAEKDELVELAGAVGFGRKKGGALVKRSFETDEQFKARTERSAEQEKKMAALPTVSYAEYFAPNTIASRQIKGSPAQAKVDKIGQAMTQLAFYKDPRTRASFEAAKKKIDDPFKKIVRGLKSVADVGMAIASVLPLPLAGQAVSFLYKNLASGALDEGFAKDDAFKAKYEGKKEMMDKYLANEQKLLEAYATAKKELEEYKLSQYKAYVAKKGGVTGGRKPTDQQFLSLVKTSYQPTPPPQLEGFQLVVNTPTVDAFVDEATKSVMLTLRGTVPTDKKDLFADANIPLNRLSKTDRYLQDKMLVQQILQRYPPDQYEIYLTGHSLGGAIVNQLKRDFPMLKDAQTFNAAFQPYDLLRQQSGQIKRKYVSTDPLYKLGGRLFQNITVVPPKSKALPLGTIGKLYDTYQGHALSNFEGSGRAVGGMGNRFERIARAYKLHPQQVKLLEDADAEFRAFGGAGLMDAALNQLAEQLQTKNRKKGQGDFDWAQYDRTFKGGRAVGGMPPKETPSAHLRNAAQMVGMFEAEMRDELTEDELKETVAEIDDRLAKASASPSLVASWTKLKQNLFNDASLEAFKAALVAEAKRMEGSGKKKTITMPIGKFKAEHKRLVKALTPAAEELAEQKAEMKKYGMGKPPMKLVTASGKVHRGTYHRMADGSIHSGKTHTKRSMPLFVKQ